MFDTEVNKKHLSWKLGLLKQPFRKEKINKNKIKLCHHYHSLNGYVFQQNKFSGLTDIWVKIIWHEIDDIIYAL